MSSELEVWSSEILQPSKSEPFASFRDFVYFVFKFLDKDSAEVGCWASITVRSVAAVYLIKNGSWISKRGMTGVRNSSKLTAIFGTKPDVFF